MAKSLASAPNNNVFAVGALASEKAPLTNADDLEDALSPPDSRLRSPRRSQASVRPGVAAPQEHAPASCFTTVPSSYPRSPSTRRQRVCSTVWRPAYAVAAASCRWPRVLVLVAASARWRGGRRVRFRPVATTRTPLVAALPHLTRSCPRRREEENRQGARHDRVPQVPRQLVLQLGKLLCRNQPVAAAIYLVFAQGKAASPEKLKHEAAVAALTAQIQLIELEASQRDPLF